MLSCHFLVTQKQDRLLEEAELNPCQDQGCQRKAMRIGAMEDLN